MTIIDKIKHWRSCFGLPNRTTPQIPDEEDQTLAVKLIQEEASELIDAIWPDDMSGSKLDQIADAIGDLYFVVTQAAMIHGLDPEMLVDRVYTSNMSKLCDNEADAKISVLEYKLKDVPTYYEELPDGKFIIKRTSDGKVLKGCHFKEPNWDDLR